MRCNVKKHEAKKATNKNILIVLSSTCPLKFSPKVQLDVDIDNNNGGEGYREYTEHNHVHQVTAIFGHILQVRVKIPIAART